MNNTKLTLQQVHRFAFEIVEKAAISVYKTYQIWQYFEN